MATVLEIARRTNLPTWTVLRVLRGEPTSEDVARRVEDAIAVLGPPDYPRAAAGALPAEITSARRQLLEAFEHAAEELRTTLPEGVGSAVFEAVRLEVRPVGEHVAQLHRLYEEVIAQLGRERAERISDVELVTELIAEGWRNVDRRLGRIERMLERLELARDEKPASGHLSVLRLES